MSTLAVAGPAADFMRSVGTKAINTLVKTTKSPAQVESDFQKIFVESFDEVAILKFFIGESAYNSMTDAEKSRYKDIVVKRLAKSYANKFKEYQGLTFEVKDGEVTENDPSFGQVTKVESTLAAPGKPTVTVTWSLVNGSDGYQIADVFVHASDAKFSMDLTNRPQYKGAWDKAQGNADTFLNAIDVK